LIDDTRNVVGFPSSLKTFVDFPVYRPAQFGEQIGVVGLMMRAGKRQDVLQGLTDQYRDLRLLLSREGMDIYPCIERRKIQITGHRFLFSEFGFKSRELGI
jgi:hypothetical protein